MSNSQSSASHPMLERLGEFAPAWRPEPGEAIVGELVAIDERDGYNDAPYPILTLATSAGECAVHAVHSVLRNEIGRANPRLGETVAIRYLGERESGRGTRYHAYKLAVDRDAVDPRPREVRRWRPERRVGPADRNAVQGAVNVDRAARGGAGR